VILWWQHEVEILMDTLYALAPYVPLLQSVGWMLLVITCAFLLRRQIMQLVDIILTQIAQGSGFKAGPLEIGPNLYTLEYVEKEPVGRVQDQKGSAGRSVDEWNTLRHGIYQHNREVFLAHVTRPLQTNMGEYDVYIYLIRHDSRDFSDIEYAEFFFGKHWGNRVIKERGKDGLIGIATSALGPFLCVCRIAFKDGKKIDLHHYVDFEMSRAFIAEKDDSLKE
jgi:hypothetical protein